MEKHPFTDLYDEVRTYLEVAISNIGYLEVARHPSDSNRPLRSFIGESLVSLMVQLDLVFTDPLKQRIMENRLGMMSTAYEKLVKRDHLVKMN